MENEKTNNYEKDLETLKKLIDLEHREETRKFLDDERKKSDDSYAKKDYEKAVRWAIIFIASGVFIAVVNAITGGLIERVLK